MSRGRLFPIGGWLLVALALAGCGGGGGGGGADEDAVRRLPGDPDGPALAALTDLAPVAAQRVDVVNGVILTKLDVLLVPTATVGEVNAALAAVQGSIVHMSARSPFLTVGVARQADARALAARARVLAAQPGIAAAFPAREAAPRVLPPGEAGSGEDAPAQLDHLLPTRFPAAWNAQGLLAGCESAKVPVLIADRFDIISAGGFDTEIPGFFSEGDTSEEGDEHGFQVSTTLAARFDEKNPTGANPFVHCLDLRGVHLGGLGTFETTSAIAAQFPTGTFILNYSKGYSDTCVEDDLAVLCPADLVAAELHTPFERAAIALDWQYRTEARSNDFLATVAAGNERDEPNTPIYPGLGRAAYGSKMAVAALDVPELLAGIQSSALWGGDATFPSLVPSAAQLSHLENLIDGWGQIAESGSDYSAAPNVLTVGSTTSSALLGELTASSFSDSGADVEAVGEKVHVLELGAPSGASVNGTSFSAPQVAGLASYLWLLSPQLRALPAAQTAAAIAANTRSNGAVHSVIDAYAAVLSLDEAAAPDPLTARIRQTLLDVDGNFGFDALDLLQFAEAYQLSEPTGSGPAARDYSRYDLNGDGYTGGITIDRFDLDRVGSTQFGAALYNLAPRTIEGIEINMNENALSDLQILCYYAYSDLYQGAADERELILGIKHCVSANLAAALGQFPAPGGSASLELTVTDESGVPIADVHVNLAASGGTVSPPSCTTGENGSCNATATLNPGTSSMSVTATARPEPGGEVLAQQTVQGQVAGEILMNARFSGSVGNEILVVSVNHPTGLGVPGANVAIERVWGGTVSPTVGVTEGSGAFVATAQPFAGWAGLMVADVRITLPGADASVVRRTASESSMSFSGQWAATLCPSGVVADSFPAKLTVTWGGENPNDPVPELGPLLLGAFEAESILFREMRGRLAYTGPAFTGSWFSSPPVFGDVARPVTGSIGDAGNVAFSGALEGSGSAQCPLGPAVGTFVGAP